MPQRRTKRTIYRRIDGRQVGLEEYSEPDVQNHLKISAGTTVECVAMRCVRVLLITLDFIVDSNVDHFLKLKLKEDLNA